MYTKYYFYILLSNLLLFELTVCEIQNKNNIVSVNTKLGQINGFRETFDGIDVDVFLGIPYAEPPIHELRFRKPLPVKEWTQPYNANQWPDNCYQILFTFELKNSKYSEDCLYLNIWSPKRDPEDNQLKAVIVFIYGGAFYYGTSTQDNYSGEVIAAKGDVVFVTFNYRLDAFGFLYADSDDAPGNVGLWDQLMAIQWIHQNIGKFGGDANRLTLMGQSAGAWSVSLHLLSPMSRHLFQNAILMSGAVYNHVEDREPSLVKQYWLNGAVSIGCADDPEHSFVDFTPHMMRCLRSVSPQKILQLATETELSIPKMAWNRLVVIDGQFLPDRPTQLLNQSLLNTTKNLLMGTVADEGSLPLNLYYDPIKYDLSSPKKFTVGEAAKELTLLSVNFPTNLEINGEEVSELYLYGLSDNTNASDVIISRIGSALGDFYITCPSIRFSELLFSSNRDYLNVYQYYYTNRLGDTSCSKWMGACHGSDLYSVLGIPLKKLNFTSKREQEISRQMIDLFSHFAKFGYPLSENGIELSPYYLISDRVLKPYFEISETQKPITNFGIGLNAIQCEYLWNEFLDN